MEAVTLLPFLTPTTAPVPTGSSFEADLRATREGRDLTLDEIQQQTRIPVDVLRRFEEGDLVGDATYNEVYLKAFLQSYAKAVGVPVARVMAAYQAHTAGSYRGELAPGFDPGEAPDARTSAPDPTPMSSSDAASPTPSEPAPPSEPAAEAAPAKPTPPARSAPPAVEALATAQARKASARPTPPPSTSTRVSRPAVPSARRSFDKNWGTILGLFAVLVVALGLALWFLVFGGDRPDDDDAPATVTVGDGQEARIDSAGVGAGAAAGGPQLQLPIRVTVTAGGDGLQWFRVTEDAGERTPHWIDQGAAQIFEADSALVLWGEGNESGPAYVFDEATFEIQGQRFTPASGQAVRITRANGQRFLDSLATASVGAPSNAPASDAAVPEPSPNAYE